MTVFKTKIKFNLIYKLQITSTQHMHKRYDLFINTQFFDQPQAQLQIPQAIQIVQNNEHTVYEDQDSHFQQLLTNNANTNHEIIRATLRIQKIFNNYLFNNLISAWNKIKTSHTTLLIVQSKFYKNPSQSLHIQKIRTEYQNQSIDSYKKSIKNKTSRIHLKSSNTDQYISIHLDHPLDQHKNHIKNNYISSSSNRQNHKQNYQRAKLLQQIMQKLKYINKTKLNMISHNDNTNKMILEGKIHRLENIVENYISDSQVQKQKLISQLVNNDYNNRDKKGSTYHNNHHMNQGNSNRNSDYSQTTNKHSIHNNSFKSEQNNHKQFTPAVMLTATSQRNQNNQLYQRINQELINIRKEMQSLKQENGKIVELQEKRRENLTKMSENQRHFQDEYARIKNQMYLIEINKQKQINLQNQQKLKLARLQQGHNHLKNDYNNLRHQIYQLQKNKAEQQFHNMQMFQTQTRQMQRTKLLNAVPINSGFYQKQTKVGGAYAFDNRQTLIPKQPNPFGYSTFADSNKDNNNDNNDNGWGYSKPPKDGNMNDQSIYPNNDSRNRIHYPDEYDPCC